MLLKKYHKLLILSLLIFILYVPYVHIITKSLNIESIDELFIYFSRAFTNKIYLRGLYISLIIVSISSLISAFISIMILSILHFNNLAFTLKYCIIILLIPIFFPDTLLGLIYSLGFKLYNISFGMFSIIISYSITGICFTFLFLNIFFGQVISNMLCAAKDIGANFFQTFFFIIIPYLLRNILYISIILLILLLNEFTIAFFVSGPSTQTLPLAIYSSIRYGMKPELYAISTFLLFIGIVLFIAINAIYSWKKDKLDFI
jgi:spermidine/putrescine transport system permease protein